MQQHKPEKMINIASMLQEKVDVNKIVKNANFTWAEETSVNKQQLLALVSELVELTGSVELKEDFGDGKISENVYMMF